MTVLDMRVATSALLCACAMACAPDFVINGDPELKVGTGQYEYEPVTAGQQAIIIHGPQGGYHVWLGVRLINMNPQGVKLESSMELAETDKPFGNPLHFEIDAFKGKSGYFEYAGLPLQFELKPARDKLVRFTVVATDPDGRVAADAMEVVPYQPPGED